MRSTLGKVHRLLDAEAGTVAVVRYSGDPDEFTALAHGWLMDEDGELYGTVSVLPPQPRLYRMNPESSDEYTWALGFPDRPGRGTWLGALLKVKQIGCSDCGALYGRHTVPCRNLGITSLVTLQFAGNGKAYGPLAATTIHAVRSRAGGGTPGPTLCDLDRFTTGTPGWSLGGGHAGPAMKFTACWLCVRTANRDLPGLPIHGMREHAEPFTAALAAAPG